MATAVRSAGFGAQRLAKPRDLVTNLGDYEIGRAALSWATARARLDGLPKGGSNIAHEAVIRHSTGERAETTALFWLGKRGERRASG